MTHTGDIYSGKIVKGFQNGRKFGFPTANVVLDDENKLPDTGVYAVKVTLNDQPLYGMLYAGTRPTLNLATLSIEIHLFNFDTDIYGQNLQFEILRKIRDERKFDSPQELIAQLKKDKEKILCLLNE